MAWIQANIGNIIVLTLVIVFVFFMIRFLIKKKGHACAGCEGCSSCGGACQEKTKEPEEKSCCACKKHENE